MSEPSEQPRRRAPIRFPPELPISARVEEIQQALAEHQVVIVAGATGSGKTTQLPKVALLAGRGGKRQIGVTQPRRIAATSVAARVAEELECELGREVGYQIRFEDRSSKETWVKFMTDGILLAETQHDPLLDGYDTLIIDEAHERSLNIDFLLGWLKRILPRRPDLKVIVSSATLETERFSSFFGDAPVISVEGRTFGVEVLYEPPPDELDLAEGAAAAVANIASLDPRGDILVFLPGEREIRETEQALSQQQLRGALVLPLYSRLAAGDQAKVFASTSQRRVILATNVAETSLTLPGVVYVVDTGVARLSRYDPRTGTTRLTLEAISQASAEQRKGRCGRVREGICVRLFDEQSFAARPAYTDPEIKRTGLSGVILRMKSLGLGAVEEFPFLDPPQSRAISEGYRVLQELGALDDEQNLTELGRQLSRFPLDPRLSRMILAGAEHGCLDDILVLAAALSIQDPRERPRGLEAKADQLHARFRDPSSDFSGLLKLWAFLREQASRSSAQLRRACKETFLSFVRVREWREVYRQLEDVVRELRLRPQPARPKKKDGEAPAADEAVHLALLSGLLSRVGQWSSEHRVYLGSRQTRFMLHPASGLAKKPPAWVMAFELVETSQLFARTAAKIDPLWLDRVGGHLLKRSYSEPHWSEKSARASVREHATLFGLPVLRDRSVDYATIAPTRARLMFLEHALVRGEYQTKAAFQRKNRELLAEVARLRDKARQSDMLADDEALLSFFDRRVPAEVVNGKTFEAWRERAEQQDPQLLLLGFEDVLGSDQNLAPELYPDSVRVLDVELPASYRFEPGADDDGVSLRIPLVLLPQLGNGELDGSIPAWQERKVFALLDELPRALRRELGGELKQLAADLRRHLEGSQGPLLELLSRGLFELRGASVEPSQFRPEAIPGHLHFYFRVVGEQGQVVGEGRDLGQLRERFTPAAREALRRAAPREELRRAGIVAWDFAELPARVTHRVHGSDVSVFPALIERDGAVAIELFETPAAAQRAHLAGVRRLLQLACKGTLAALDKRMPPPLSRRAGLPASKAEQTAFAELVRVRLTSEAFGLASAAELPRTRADFQRLLALGTPRLVPVFEATLKLLGDIRGELDQTTRALDAAKLQPSGAQASADIREQLELLFRPDLLQHSELGRLAHLPRYLAAARARLTRAIHDPRKDASKGEPIAALLRAFAAKYPQAADRASAQRLLFNLEELRVATFAPELRPQRPPSIADAASELAELT